MNRNRHEPAARMPRSAAPAINAAVFAVLCCLAAVAAPCSLAAASWDPAAVLQEHFRQQTPWATVEVSEVRLREPAPAAPPSSVSAERSPSGRTTFTLAYPGGKSVAGTALVRTYDRAVMSRGSFNKGYQLREADVYSALLETGKMPRDAVREEGRVVGRVLTRSVLPGLPLTESMVAPSPIVRKGQKVKLLAARGAFSIRTMGEIRQDAALGDYVKAVNLQSRKIVAGILVDENTVKVDF